MTESKLHFFPFLVYLVIFHAIWMGGYVFIVYPWMQMLGDATLIYALGNITIRLIVWVLPVILYLRYIDHADPFEYLKLKQKWKQGVAVRLSYPSSFYLPAWCDLASPTQPFSP